MNQKTSAHSCNRLSTTKLEGRFSPFQLGFPSPAEFRLFATSSPSRENLAPTWLRTSRWKWTIQYRTSLFRSIRTSFERMERNGLDFEPPLIYDNKRNPASQAAEEWSSTEKAFFNHPAPCSSLKKSKSSLSLLWWSVIRDCHGHSLRSWWTYQTRTDQRREQRHCKNKSDKKRRSVAALRCRRTNGREDEDKTQHGSTEWSILRAQHHVTKKKSRGLCWHAQGTTCQAMRSTTTTRRRSIMRVHLWRLHCNPYTRDGNVHIMMLQIKRAWSTSSSSQRWKLPPSHRPEETSNRLVCNLSHLSCQSGSR